MRKASGILKDYYSNLKVIFDKQIKGSRVSYNPLKLSIITISKSFYKQIESLNLNILFPTKHFGILVPAFLW